MDSETFAPDVDFADAIRSDLDPTLATQTPASAIAIPEFKD